MRLINALHSHLGGHPNHSHHRKDAQTVGPATEGRLIRWAKLYDPLVWLLTLGRTRALRAVPLDIADLRPGERVLEVGCGTGDVALSAARRVGRSGSVYGIDASPEMIAVARRKARRAPGTKRAGRAGPSVQFLVEPAEALSFPDGSFDVVLSSLMMHHLPERVQRRALLEIRRVLRPGGRVAIVDFQAGAGRAGHLWKPTDLAMRLHGHRHAPVHGVSSAVEDEAGLSALAALLHEAGYVDVESGPTRNAWLGYALGRAPS